jgi:DNA-binding NarL/FixJ family response regulator
MDGIAAGVFAAPCITALIVGRPTLFRHGLTGILRDHHTGWILIECDSVAAIASDRLSRKPDVILLDERVQDLDGVVGLRRVRGLFPAAKILILSDDDDRDQVLDFIDSGANGYVTTSANPSQVLAAFNTVLCGGVFIPASPRPASGQLASRLPKSTAPRGLTPEGFTPRGLVSQDFSAAGLTGRQRDVFDLMARGYPTKMIARELGLAVGTVKVHLAAIYRLLGAHSRIEAVAKLVGGGSHVEATRTSDPTEFLSGPGWRR